MDNSKHIKGLADLQKFLDVLPVKVEKNIMRGALRAGMNVVKPDAQSRIHNVSGALAKSLKVGTRARGGKVTANLRSRASRAEVPQNLDLWLEYGTRPHFISVQDSEKPINRRLSNKRGRVVLASMSTVNRYVRSLKIAGRFVGPTVFHPGSQPKPFMRPALDAQARAAVVAAGEYVKTRLSTKHGIDTAHIRVEGDE